MEFEGPYLHVRDCSGHHLLIPALYRECWDRFCEDDDYEEELGPYGFPHYAQPYDSHRPFYYEKES